MDEQRERREVPARWIAMGVVAVVLVVFIAQNYDPVDVDILFVSRRIRLAWALLLAAALGFIAGLIAPRLRHR